VVVGSVRDDAKEILHFNSCLKSFHVSLMFFSSLKNANCLRQFSSYRATFELPEGQWTTIRLPWDSFCGHGCGAVENALDVSSLRRIGVVAIGKGMDVTLALSSIRFFGEASLQHGLA
jgi:hypothetical protein